MSEIIGGGDNGDTNIHNDPINSEISTSYGEITNGLGDPEIRELAALVSNIRHHVEKGIREGKLLDYKKSIEKQLEDVSSSNSGSSRVLETIRKSKSSLIAYILSTTIATNGISQSITPEFDKTERLEYVMGGENISFKNTLATFGFNRESTDTIFAAIKVMENNPNTPRIMEVTKSLLDNDRGIYLENSGDGKIILHISYGEENEITLEINNKGFGYKQENLNGPIKVSGNGLSYYNDSKGNMDLGLGMEVVGNDGIKIKLEGLTKTSADIILGAYSEIGPDLFKSLITIGAKVGENGNLIFACGLIREEKDFFDIGKYINQGEVGFEYLQKLSDSIVDYLVFTGKLKKSWGEKIKTEKFSIETDTMIQLFDRISYAEGAIGFEIEGGLGFIINKNNKLEITSTYEWLKYDESGDTENNFGAKLRWDQTGTFSSPLSGIYATGEYKGGEEKREKLGIGAIIPFLEKSSVQPDISYDFNDGEYTTSVNYNYRFGGATNSQLEKENSGTSFELDENFRMQRQRQFMREFLSSGVSSKEYQETKLTDTFYKKIKPKVTNNKPKQKPKEEPEVKELDSFDKMPDVTNISCKVGDKVEFPMEKGVDVSIEKGNVKLVEGGFDVLESGNDTATFSRGGVKKKVTFDIKKQKEVVEELKDPKLAFEGGVETIEKQEGDSSFTIKATAEGNGKISYYSSNPKVVEVDPKTGKVTIVGNGEAVIKAYYEEGTGYEDASTSYTVKVEAKPNPDPEPEPEPIDNKAPEKTGESFDIQYKGYPFSGSMTFDEEIASVSGVSINGGGTVSATIDGKTVNFTGTTGYDADYFTVEVTVRDKAGKSVQISSNSYSAI